MKPDGGEHLVAPVDPMAVVPLGYTVSQACRVIPCSRSHLHRAIKAGHLRAVRDGRKVLISRQAIIDYLATGDGTSQAEPDVQTSPAS
jgi:excisionase family DNA binding protein